MRNWKTSLKALAWVLALVLTPLSQSGSTHANTTTNNLEMVQDITLKEVIIKAKKLKITRSRTFLGFQLQQPLNTNVCQALKTALLNYSGPAVKISSLKRFWNRKSKHASGRAVDLEFSHDTIEWLVSTAGASWRESHGIKTFYIEGKPGSKALRRYKSDSLYSKYVFENRGATGDHIHLDL